MARLVVVSTRGTDLYDRGKTVNAHVRLERPARRDPLMIVVTVFDNVREEFIEARSFDNDVNGVEEATRYLRTNGIAGVRLEPGRARAGELRRVKVRLAIH